MVEADGNETRPRAVVLVVDDDPAVCRLLSNVLQLHGFECRTAASVVEAIAAITHGPVDALILDLWLGEDDAGLDVLGWIRSTPQHCQLPALILTGRNVSEDEEALIRRNRAHVFYKLQSYEALVDHLRRVTLPNGPN